MAVPGVGLRTMVKSIQFSAIMFQISRPRIAIGLSIITRVLYNGGGIGEDLHFEDLKTVSSNGTSRLKVNA